MLVIFLCILVGSSNVLKGFSDMVLKIISLNLTHAEKAGMFNHFKVHASVVTIIKVRFTQIKDCFDISNCRQECKSTVPPFNK